MTKGGILAMDIRSVLNDYDNALTVEREEISDRIKKIASRISPMAVACAVSPNGTHAQRHSILSRFSGMIRGNRPYSERFIVACLRTLYDSGIDPEKMVKYSHMGQRGQGK